MKPIYLPPPNEITPEASLELFQCYDVYPVKLAYAYRIGSGVRQVWNVLDPANPDPTGIILMLGNFGSNRAIITDSRNYWYGVLSTAQMELIIITLVYLHPQEIKLLNEAIGRMG